MHKMDTTELVPSVSVANLINQREAVRVKLEAARSALLDVADILESIDTQTGKPQRFYRGVSQLVVAGTDYLSLVNDDGIVSAMKRFDGTAWQHLMHASGLRSLMDATAREQWDKSLGNGEFPELTKANIEATFAQLHGARGDMFERGVIACFKGLSWDYKTNLPQKFGKRIVVKYLTGWHSNQKSDGLDDLMRVMHILDGKPEPDCRGGVYEMLKKAGLTYGGRAGCCENEYLSLRAFKNQNGHITFKRLDLVDRMNKIIAKHYPGALPAPK